MLRAGQLLRPEKAFDAALRRRAFPPDAGSLLRGSLAITPTGLSPAGGHELVRGLLQTRHLLPFIPVPTSLGTTNQRPTDYESS
jgi:hypothetical protein